MGRKSYKHSTTIKNSQKLNVRKIFKEPVLCLMTLECGVHIEGVDQNQPVQSQQQVLLNILSPVFKVFEQL